MPSPHPLLNYRNPYVNEVIQRGEKRRRPVESDEEEEPVRNVRRMYTSSGRSSTPGSSPVRLSIPLTRRPILSLGPLVMFRGSIRRRRYTKTTADMGKRRNVKKVFFKESMPFPDDESSVSDDDDSESDSDEVSEDDDDEDEDWDESKDCFVVAYLAETIVALKAVAATPYDFETEDSASDWVPSLPKGRRRKVNAAQR